MKITKEIIIFQAPYASLVDSGVLKQVLKQGYQPEGVIDKVPAQYYMPVFHGTVALEVKNAETNTLLEGIFSAFNLPNRPNAMTMRSLSAGDVICVDGGYYLVQPFGYAKVKFEAPAEGDPDIPKPESREDFGRYLKEKYNINGKAATLLDNLLEYNNCQGWERDDEDAFLEAMLSGLGVSSEDRGLPHRLDVYEDIESYIHFEEETSIQWAWAISAEEMLANREALNRVVDRLLSAEDSGDEVGTDEIYEELISEFGGNPALDGRPE